MARNYDLIVIGTGTAASTAAKRCRGAGWSVAVADERPFGGTCALRGCDPKKVLLGAAEAVERPRRLVGKGLRYAALEVDWPDLMAFKRRFTDPVPEAREQSFKKLGIEAFHGHARLSGEQAVTVDGEAITGRHILLACGAKPAALGIAGEEHLTTSEAFMNLGELPQRIVMVGGGYIAFELAHLARRAGAEVTIIEQGPRFLGAFDPDVVGWLVERSRELGIDLHLDTAVEAIEPDGNGFIVRCPGEGSIVTFPADLVVHAAGRVPALDPSELDAAGIDHDHGRIKLNEYLQSQSNPRIYAAGDAAQCGPALTPVASRDAEVAAANMLEGNHREADYAAVPSAVFTIPPLASVGLQEGEARSRGLDFHVNCEKTAAWYANKRVNEEAAGFKVLIDRESKRILGAHLLGPQADELINIFALAMSQDLSAEDLKDTAFAYPTAASNLDSMLAC